jgi:biopolymer transport protein ExbB
MKKTGFKRMAAVGLLLMLSGIWMPVRAQNAPADPQAVTADVSELTGQSRSLTFGALLKQGGWAMWPLGFFSAAMLFFIVRNGLMLRRKDLLRPDLSARIEPLLKEGKVDELRLLCKENAGLITTVLDAGLERISERDTDIEHVKEAIEEAANEQMVTYMKPINYLSIIGGISPMLGLLGTVSGMIKAFQEISAGGMGKPELLAGHIGEALITTAAGLTIAIPAMVAYFIFKNNFIRHMSGMERMIGHYMNVYRNARGH